MANPSSSGTRKLVSIICRSVGRRELEQALTSVSAQTYANLEIILVDALATGLDNFLAHCGTVPANIVSEGRALKRSAAANAGLDRAKGDYIMFLDDDDWIAPGHIDQLVTFIESNTGCDAVYSSTRRVNSAGEELEYVFDDDFDKYLLMRDNFIPIHAMLFSKSLLEKGCRFDESFDLYEDWDFWLQLNQHTEFKHLDSVTAFYRESGESGIDEGKMTQRLDAGGPLGQARAKVFDKWLKRWSGAEFNRLVGEIDNTELIARLNADLKAENAGKQEKERLLIERDRQLEQTQNELNDANNRVEDLNKYVAHLLEQIDLFKAHVARLERQLQDIFSSTSWKLSKPLRAAGRLLKGRPSQPPAGADVPGESDNEK